MVFISKDKKFDIKEEMTFDKFMDEIVEKESYTLVKEGEDEPRVRHLRKTLDSLSNAIKYGKRK